MDSVCIPHNFKNTAPPIAYLGLVVYVRLTMNMRLTFWRPLFIRKVLALMLENMWLNALGKSVAIWVSCKPHLDFYPIQKLSTIQGSVIRSPLSP